MVFIQPEPVLAFTSLELVNDYIFLIENNFTMIKEDEKALILKKCKISFYFDIYTSYVCRYNNYSVGDFKRNTTKNHILE